MNYEWAEGKGREMGSKFLVGLCGFSRVHGPSVRVFGWNRGGAEGAEDWGRARGNYELGVMNYEGDGKGN